MTYQRFSGVRVSMVISVIVATPTARDDADEPAEDRVQDRDVQPDDEADGEDQHGQVADLLARRPGDLAEFGPDFIEIAAEAGHVGAFFSRLRRKVAGAIGLEPTTAGFGDQCSAN